MELKKLLTFFKDKLVIKQQTEGTGKSGLVTYSEMLFQTFYRRTFAKRTWILIFFNEVEFHQFVCFF